MPAGVHAGTDTHTCTDATLRCSHPWVGFGWHYLEDPLQAQQKHTKHASQHVQKMDCFPAAFRVAHAAAGTQSNLCTFRLAPES